MARKLGSRVSKRNLFVSFAESDGGHSYLAARAMLDPGSIAHLIFRNTVAESLEAVAAGQANYAVVPCYNSITQWDGATIKALSSGAYEIFGQVCMPTSYVLVAHKDYISEFLQTYASIKNVAELTPEEEAKIYTRFLTRIFVGAQADEQYRGRLSRPDLTGASIELSRNPLRVLEEQSRSDLVKQMMKANRQPPATAIPGNLSGGGIQVLTQPAVVVDAVQAPAALVAAGLLDAPGDPEGWDQPGSLGEMVSLLRKLLVLLNVYSFGSPDLPENKTSYLLVGRRGAGAPPASAIRSPAAAPTRVMTMVRPSIKKSSADQWMKPRSILSKKAREYGFVFDRPPVMISPGNQRIFLFEGGRPKDGFSTSPNGFFENLFGWVGDLFSPPPDTKGQPAGVKAKDKSLRKALEKKPESAKEIKDDAPEKFDAYFLGQYPTWCHGLSDDACWCCEEAHSDTHATSGAGIGPLVQFLIAGLIALTMLALLFVPAYCALTGASCNPFATPRTDIQLLPPPVTPTQPQETPAEPTPPPVVVPKVTPPERVQTPYPGLNGTTPSTTKPSATGITQPTSPKVTAAPKIEVQKPLPVFHVAFFEAKSNLTYEAQSALAAAAAQSIQQSRNATVRLVALGPRENDDDLWRRRLYAVKDELVRLGVPADRIRYEGTGPYVVTIRAAQSLRPTTGGGGGGGRRASLDTESIPDPLSSD